MALNLLHLRLCNLRRSKLQFSSLPWHKRQCSSQPRRYLGRLTLAEQMFQARDCDSIRKP